MERLTDKLNELNDQGKLEYNDYSILFDLAYELEETRTKLENGTLVELPCRIGQLIYFIARCCDGCKYFNCNYINAWCSLSANEITSECGNHLVIREKKFTFSMRDQIGKTIFLTREEAEKRLEELRK